jgi:eukaryotic-like serine/threonine-protein kinase
MMRLSNSRAAKVLIAIIAVIFIAGISLTGIIALLPQKVTVPDFTGKSLNEADTLAKKSGLTLKATTGSSAEYDHGQVISQNPAEGQKVSAGATVEVEVNR